MKLFTCDRLFRVCLYGALIAGIFCTFSPFGWGLRAENYPQVNHILSTAVSVMIFFAGLLTIKNWKGTTASFKGVLLPMLDTFLVLMVAWLGFESFTAQQSPRLRFEELGKDILLFQLVVLAIFACQWWLRRLCKKEQHEPV